MVVDLQAREASERCADRMGESLRHQIPGGVLGGTRRARFDGGPKGEWKTFPSGAVNNAQGGTVTLKLADAPVSTRFLRVLMTESSNTCDEHGAGDIRNCVGYAIQQIAAGSVDGSGAFSEALKDAAEKRTTFCASSIDPWHSADDVNDGGSYQHSGFDLFFTSGLTNNLPAMIPVTMLYGTPDDAAAQIAYIKKRGYPIGYIEMGEEPDGKHAMPEDYAALYLQWATRSSQSGPKTQAGRAGLRRRQRRHHSVAGRAGADVVDGPVRRLSKIARPFGRPFFCVLRALSV